MCIQLRIDRRTPYCCFIRRENFFKMIHSLTTCNDRRYMNMGRLTFRKQSLIRIFHRSPRSQHRIGKYQCFSIQAGRGYILNMNIKMLFILIFSVRRDKSIFCVVEIIQKTLMKRQAGTQDSSYNRTKGRHFNKCFG